MADEFKLVEKSRIMDATRMKRALSRLASEIVEENQGADDLYLVGIRRRGVPLAERSGRQDQRPPKANVLYTAFSISPFIATISPPSVQTRSSTVPSSKKISVTRSIVLVDDVLYTGRTIRAALDQFMDFGRPRKVQLAVLIDRGREHRELPIQADFVGKTVPTKSSEIIKVMLKEFDDIEAVGIFEQTA